MSSTYLSLSAKDVAKIIHSELSNPNSKVLEELKNLFLQDSADMVKDEFLDNVTSSDRLSDPDIKEFLAKTNTSEFYKERAVVYAKDLITDLWSNLEFNIKNSNFAVYSNVKTALAVNLEKVD